jgi:hypothetical protein
MRKFIISGVLALVLCLFPTKGLAQCSYSYTSYLLPTYFPMSFYLYEDEEPFSRGVECPSCHNDAWYYHSISLTIEYRCAYCGFIMKYVF